MSTRCPGIAGIAYALPAESRSVRELAEAGQLQTKPEVLERFGFDRVHVATEESPYELAARAASELLEEQHVDPASVGLLTYSGPPGTLSLTPAAEPWDAAAALATTARFKYPGTRLQYELGLINASVLGVDQLACSTLFGALRVARSLCATEGIERALCVNAEFFPAAAGREAVFNCTSDAACAVLLERDAARNHIAASVHITKGYYWDGDARKSEVVASYFPTSKYAIERAIAEAGWSPADVDWIIPHNVSLRSWELLLSLLTLPNARLWADNIPRRGHSLAGDNFINLRDALDGGAVRPGQKLVLFAYGYGAHWTALAVEA
ncbi:MAG TPA: 3-oxoacyl-[acyl-carrier-protein] synthase III C-terminal domain-containing protein [Gemmatimonadales bacterium]|nr:3-oxoacyl-[acyl-carrier-protein] synthase III C-terminal domain-containing protein [Gemmatimonadales bacterium]